MWFCSRCAEPSRVSPTSSHTRLPSQDKHVTYTTRSPTSTAATPAPQPRDSSETPAPAPRSKRTRTASVDIRDSPPLSAGQNKPASKRRALFREGEGSGEADDDDVIIVKDEPVDESEGLPPDWAEGAGGEAEVKPEIDQDVKPTLKVHCTPGPYSRVGQVKLTARAVQIEASTSLAERSSSCMLFWVSKRPLAHAADRSPLAVSSPTHRSIRKISPDRACSTPKSANYPPPSLPNPTADRCPLDRPAVRAARSRSRLRLREVGCSGASRRA